MDEKPRYKSWVNGVAAIAAYVIGGPIGIIISGLIDAASGTRGWSSVHTGLTAAPIIIALFFLVRQLLVRIVGLDLTTLPSPTTPASATPDPE